jgi:hypothetical protein
MQWVKCSHRLPTEADGDYCGDVICRIKEEGGWAFTLLPREDVAEFAHEWLSGACECDEVKEVELLPAYCWGCPKCRSWHYQRRVVRAVECGMCGYVFEVAQSGVKSGPGENNAVG